MLITGSDVMVLRWRSVAKSVCVSLSVSPSLLVLYACTDSPGGRS